MLKNTLIIALLILVLYLYYQNKKLKHYWPLERIFVGTDAPQEIEEVKKVNQVFADFCKNEIGGQDINEIRTKLNGRTLTEILEENEDYETTVDNLTRKKGELEAEVTSLTTAWKNRVGEKERIITRLTQEKSELEKKYKKKAKSLDEEQCENNKLTKQNEFYLENIKTKEGVISDYQKEIQELEKEHQQQLRQINLLFDPQAKNYAEIDFTGLYLLLENVKQGSEGEWITSTKKKK